MPRQRVQWIAIVEISSCIPYVDDIGYESEHIDASICSFLKESIEVPTDVAIIYNVFVAYSMGDGKAEGAECPYDDDR